MLAQPAWCWWSVVEAAPGDAIRLEHGIVANAVPNGLHDRTHRSCFMELELGTISVKADASTRGTRMNEPSFGCRPGRATADNAELSTRAAIAPTKNDDLDQIKEAVLAKLALDLGKHPSVATDRDWFVAAALTLRDRIVHRWLEVDRASHAPNCAAT